MQIIVKSTDGCARLSLQHEPEQLGLMLVEMKPQEEQLG